MSLIYNLRFSVAQLKHLKTSGVAVVWTNCFAHSHCTVSPSFDEVVQFVARTGFPSRITRRWSVPSPDHNYCHNNYQDYTSKIRWDANAGHFISCAFRMFWICESVLSCVAISIIFGAGNVIKYDFNKNNLFMINIL